MKVQGRSRPHHRSCRVPGPQVRPLSELGDESHRACHQGHGEQGDQPLDRTRGRLTVQRVGLGSGECGVGPRQVDE